MTLLYQGCSGYYIITKLLCSTMISMWLTWFRHNLLLQLYSSCSQSTGKHTALELVKTNWNKKVENSLIKANTCQVYNFDVQVNQIWYKKPTRPVITMSLNSFTIDNYDAKSIIWNVFIFDICTNHLKPRFFHIGIPRANQGFLPCFNLI